MPGQDGASQLHQAHSVGPTPPTACAPSGVAWLPVYHMVDLAVFLCEAVTHCPSWSCGSMYSMYVVVCWVSGCLQCVGVEGKVNREHATVDKQQLLLAWRTGWQSRLL
jgi:hypothetical protein